MNRQVPRLLVIGYGNPGRLDDGLGPRVAERIETLAIPGVTAETDYQLQVEHALLVARHDAAIFVDADTAGPAPFSWRRLEPVADTGFTTHALDPAAVLAAARDHFDASPPAYLLAVRGYRFNAFGEELSAKAAANLSAAADFLEARLREGRIATPPAVPSAGEGLCDA